MLLVLLVLVAVLGILTGLGWMMDQQLQEGLIEQRRAAMQRPDWVPLNTLPNYVPQAFILVVDPAFQERGTVAIGMESTLQRELVRQVHLLDDSMAGQARQLMLSPLLEAHLSRRQILELYLNRVHLGEEEGLDVFGIHHAAREYFDKEPQELTLSEAATLAGFLLSPPLQDPRRSAGAVGARRNEVLRQMLAAGLITPQEMQAALQEPLAFQPGLQHAPMTRRPGWYNEPEPIRVPEAEPTEEGSGAAE